MSFAKDILGIPKKGASSSGLPTEFAASPPQPVSRKKEGVPRELLHLGGGISSSPTIAPSVSFKEKPQQKVSWHRKAFSNSARTDELKLSQWTKDEIVGEYPFAKFNRKVKIVEYSDEDYKSMLNNFQPLPKKSEKEPNGFEPWTREETDELFKMCIEYDLRFVVINDRWPPKFKPRSIDELKDRYFSVARKILESRQKAKQPAPTGAFAKHCSAIVLNPYDIEYEMLRKKQLEAQYKRSKGELRQEEETVREARRIEANRKRILKERQRIQKLLLPAGDIAVTDVDEAGPARGQKSRSMKMTIPGTVEPILTLPTKSFQHRKSWNCAHARSSFIYQSIKQSARLAKRVEILLDELKVGLRPMATAAVVDAYDMLRVEILAHIEMQRTVTRKEEEVHVLKVKLAKLKKETPPAPPPGINLSHKKRKHEESAAGAATPQAPAPASSPAGPSLGSQTPLHKRRKRGA